MSNVKLFSSGSYKPTNLSLEKSKSSMSKLFVLSISMSLISFSKFIEPDVFFLFSLDALSVLSRLQISTGSFEKLVVLKKKKKNEK